MKSKCYGRGDAQSDAAIEAAAGDLLTAVRDDANMRRENERDDVRTILRAIRDRQGIFLFYDYEDAAWGFPEAIRKGKSYRGADTQIIVTLRTSEGTNEIAVGYFPFGAEIITAPEDAVIPRYPVTAQGKG